MLLPPRLRAYLDRRMLNWVRRLLDAEDRRQHAGMLAALKRLGDGALIEPGVRLFHPERIQIGDGTLVRTNSRLEAVTSYGDQQFTPTLRIGARCVIELGVHIAASYCVEIGDDVMIAGRVFLSDHLHQYEDVARPVSRQPLSGPAHLSIGDGAFIGEGACILPGVAVGRHSVIGANAVVTRSVPDCCVAAGVPARVLRHYDAARGEWADGPPTDGV